MLSVFERAALYVLHDHESFEGKRHADGLKGFEIPIALRIVSVIDAFDAMVSRRPYRQGLPFEEAIRLFILGSGVQFDPSVFQASLPLAQAEMVTVFAGAGTEVSATLRSAAVPSREQRIAKPQPENQGQC